MKVKILGIWCAVTSFITPHWLTLTFLNVTGLIYKYDYTMDEGTAGFFGITGLILWLLLVLLPDILLLKYVKSVSRRGLLLAIGAMILLAVISLALCNWNPVAYWCA